MNQDDYDSCSYSSLTNDKQSRQCIAIMKASLSVQPSTTPFSDNHEAIPICNDNIIENITRNLHC